MNLTSNLINYEEFVDVRLVLLNDLINLLPFEGSTELSSSQVLRVKMSFSWLQKLLTSRKLATS